MKTRIENFINGLISDFDRRWRQAKAYSRKCQQVYNNIYTS